MYCISYNSQVLLFELPVFKMKLPVFNNYLQSLFLKMKDFQKSFLKLQPIMHLLKLFKSDGQVLDVGMMCYGVDVLVFQRTWAKFEPHLDNFFQFSNSFFSLTLKLLSLNSFKIIHYYEL